MTDRPIPIDEALEEHDVTLALSRGQLLLLVIGALLLIRILRGLRR